MSFVRASVPLSIQAAAPPTTPARMVLPSTNPAGFDRQRSYRTLTQDYSPQVLARAVATRFGGQGCDWHISTKTVNSCCTGLTGRPNCAQASATARQKSQNPRDGGLCATPRHRQGFRRAADDQPDRRRAFDGCGGAARLSSTDHQYRTEGRTAHTAAASSRLPRHSRAPFGIRNSGIRPLRSHARRTDQRPRKGQTR